MREEEGGERGVSDIPSKTRQYEPISSKKSQRMERDRIRKLDYSLQIGKRIIDRFTDEFYDFAARNGVDFHKEKAGSEKVINFKMEYYDKLRGDFYKKIASEDKRLGFWWDSLIWTDERFLYPNFVRGKRIEGKKPPCSLITVIDANGTRNDLGVSVGGFVDNPVWSPKGDKIAFGHRTVKNHTTSDIFIMNPDGSEETNLTSSSEVSEKYPYFSSDGRKIVYSVQKGDKSEIWVMDIDGENKVCLTEELDAPYNPFIPLFIPEGDKIVVSFFGENNPHYVIELE